MVDVQDYPSHSFDCNTMLNVVPGQRNPQGVQKSVVEEMLLFQIAIQVKGHKRIAVPVDTVHWQDTIGILYDGVEPACRFVG